MINITKPGVIPPQQPPIIFIQTCPKCACEFEYDTDEFEISHITGHFYINCPTCDEPLKPSCQSQ